MIRVFVRESDESYGVLLGEFCPSDLQALIRCFYDSPTYMPISGKSGEYIASQFIIGEKNVTFEIIVG